LVITVTVVIKFLTLLHTLHLIADVSRESVLGYVNHINSHS